MCQEDSNALKARAPDSSVCWLICFIVLVFADNNDGNLPSDHTSPLHISRTRQPNPSQQKTPAARDNPYGGHSVKQTRQIKRRFPYSTRSNISGPWPQMGHTKSAGSSSPSHSYS